jgi:hypothetical protein
MLEFPPLPAPQLGVVIPIHIAPLSATEGTRQ